MRARQVRRVVETPEGPGPEEEFEMVGHVIYYDANLNKFTCEFEDGGEDAFTPEELERVMLPDEVGEGGAWAWIAQNLALFAVMQWFLFRNCTTP